MKRFHKHLRVGTEVEVFEDPITETKREGAARVRGHIEHVSTLNGRELHRYRVCFIGTTDIVERTVLHPEAA